MQWKPSTVTNTTMTIPMSMTISISMMVRNITMRTTIAMRMLTNTAIAMTERRFMTIKIHMGLMIMIMGTTKKNPMIIHISKN
ncbi:MAG: hypothetical protein KKE44_20995 [Proteobacteria bacterium]|nr:hypothetical protein [Pseudomonadota bacterium]MBU1585210.1 hypothetical protein [Pseudomonadota bacterium]MBU2454523.1 hypothetical protein [Pseudomonadota bacterium]MBU2629100.1 hypothetical protein [Pseudomonadota bacterium]